MRIFMVNMISGVKVDLVQGLLHQWVQEFFTHPYKLSENTPKTTIFRIY
jgi:hypothetical protein